MIASRFTVGVVRSYTKGPKIDSIAVPPSNGQNLGQALETGKGKDVNFKVGETLAAHSVWHGFDYKGSLPEKTASQPSSHVEGPLVLSKRGTISFLHGHAE